MVAATQLVAATITAAKPFSDGASIENLYTHNSPSNLDIANHIYLKHTSNAQIS
jgi:hypothetical protein